MTDKEQEILDFLDGKLLGMGGNYPIVYAQMKEKINTRRRGFKIDKDSKMTANPWSDELIKAIDERLEAYEREI